jgi:predicted deacylase
MHYWWSIQAGQEFARPKSGRVVVALLSLCLLASSGSAVAADSALLDETPVSGPQGEHASAELEGDEELINHEFDDNATGKVIVDSYGHEYVQYPRALYVGPPKPADVDEPRVESEKKKLVVAANIDLSEPVAPLLDVNGIDIGMIAPPVEPTVAVYPQKSLLILGAEVAASTSTRLAWSPDQSFAGIAVPTPVLIVNGAKPGPVLCVTAAIHGDELNGIEVVRRILYDLEPEKLSGTVIGVPIVNLQGFHRASRYLPDRRDLNRYFPGNPNGSAASRLAHSFFTEVISHCSALVDLHTGSFQRSNLPQLRADLNNPKIVELTQGFGSTVVLHGRGAAGTLRRAAADAGIPTVTLEAGEPARVQNNEVAHSTKGIMTLLNELGMYSRTTNWGHREPVYYHSKWVRADSGGVLISKVELGDRVRKNELLGTVTDPITNVQTELRASVKGRILGMALDQFVMPGFAAFRIGIEKPDTEISVPSPIAVSENDSGAESADSDSDSTALADTDYESYDESGDDSEPLDARDYLEDSE